MTREEMEKGLAEFLQWVHAAKDAFHYDMGVLTAKEKSIYRAFIAADQDRRALIEIADAAEKHHAAFCVCWELKDGGRCPICAALRRRG